MNRGYISFAIIAACMVLTPVILHPLVEASDVWVSKASIPTARKGFGVAVVNGKIYTIGGYNENRSQLGTNEMYDPETNTWSTKATMPTPRAYFAVAVIQNKIYTISGETDHTSFSSANEVYDTLTDTWETKPQLKTKTTGLEYVSANVVDGKIYVISGLASPWPVYPNSYENYVYDPTTETWTTKAPIPQPVHGYASAVVGSKIYIIGGRDFLSDSLTINLTQIYDTTTDRWSNGTQMPSPAYNAMGGVINAASPKIYIIGGVHYGEPAEITKPMLLNVTRIYDPATDTWSTGTLVPNSDWSQQIAIADNTIYSINAKSNYQYKPINSPDDTPTQTISPTPSTSPSPTPTLSPAFSPSPAQQPTPSPSAIPYYSADYSLKLFIIGLVTLATVVGLLVYFKKVKK